MKHTAKWSLLVLVCLVLLSLACGQSSNIKNVAADSQNANSANSGESDSSSESESDSELSQDELKDKWHTPVVSYAMVSGICQSALESATKANNGEVDDAGLSGEFFGMQLLIGITDKAISEWEASAGQQDYKDSLTERIANVSSIVEAWNGGTSTAEEAQSELDKECQAIDKEAEQMIDAAKAEGLTEDMLEAIATEMQESLTLDSESESDSDSSSAEPVAQEEEEEAIPTEVGMSRQNPYSMSEVVSAPNWDIQVLETKRGQEAWQMIQAANMFNSPAETGMEYLLVRIKVKCNYADEEEHTISNGDFNVTGSKLHSYGFTMAVAPDPVLDASLYAGGEAEGWTVFEIGQGEDQLILEFDEVSNWDSGRQRFIALEEGASIGIPEEIKGIEANDLGTSRSEPAPLGETVITDDWKLTVLEVVRGDQAWTNVQAANEFNDAPEAGMEYVLVKLSVDYIGLSNLAESMDITSFNITGSENQVYDFPFVVEPDPKLDASLFPGGNVEGWIALQVKQGESGLILIFEPFLDFSSDSQRFLALE